MFVENLGRETATLFQCIVIKSFQSIAYIFQLSQMWHIVSIKYNPSASAQSVMNLVQKSLRPDHVHQTKHQELKNIEYFNEIFKIYPDLQLKEVLPNYVSRLTTKTFDHEAYVYIPAVPMPKNTLTTHLSHRTFDDVASDQSSIIQSSEGGSDEEELAINKFELPLAQDGILNKMIVCSSMKKLGRRAKFYRVSRNLHEALCETVMKNVKIPVCQGLTTHRKFNLFSISKVQRFLFNRLIFQAGPTHQPTHTLSTNHQSNHHQYCKTNASRQDEGTQKTKVKGCLLHSKSNELISPTATNSKFRQPDQNKHIFNGIYYILEGQVKTISYNTHSQKIHKTMGSGNFLGIEELASNDSEWRYSTISNSNQTTLLFVSKQFFSESQNSNQIKQMLIEHIHPDKLYTKGEDNTKLTAKNFRLVRNNKEQHIEKREAEKGEQKLDKFMKRCEQFQQAMNINSNPDFRQYLNHKKMLIKLKGVIDIKNQKSHNLKLPRNARKLPQFVNTDRNLNLRPNLKELTEISNQIRSNKDQSYQKISISSYSKPMQSDVIREDIKSLKNRQQSHDSKQNPLNVSQIQLISGRLKKLLRKNHKLERLRGPLLNKNNTSLRLEADEQQSEDGFQINLLRIKPFMQKISSIH